MPSSPQTFHIPLSRRRFLQAIAAASAGFTLPGYLAEALTVAPHLTQGPYYPLAKNMPLDKDNDLAQIDGNSTIASGIITYISGRVLDTSGTPVKDALVEMWHADHAGDYIYSAGATRNKKADSNFQGFGQLLTASTGVYGFRTVKAGLYNGRTRHFHLAVTFPGHQERYTTQLFWNEVAYSEAGKKWPTQNSNDSIFRGITNAAQRTAVLINYTAVSGTTTGEVQGTFDFVLGQTPVEPTYPEDGTLLATGELVSGPSGGNPRFAITFPAYKGYTYEVYSNPTLADVPWKALPFSLTQTGAIDRARQTVTKEESLTIYVEEKAVKDFYRISFRAPGDNIGTP